MTAPRTLFEKIWSNHVIAERGSDDVLLYVDCNFVHEGSFHAFGALATAGRRVRRPRQTFGVADHYVPSVNAPSRLDAVPDPEMREMITLLESNCRNHGVTHFGIDSPRQGIVHVIGPGLGLTLPGLTVTCGDSHTSTHGALGAFAFGVGASQLKQILATQCLLQKRPRTMRISLDGILPVGLTAKDIILAVIGKIGNGGATGYVVEYAGSAIRSMGVEGRMTVCNMSIETGARAGMVSPDDRTYQYLAGGEFTPSGLRWEQAVQYWRTLPTDEGAQFDREVVINVGLLEPMVTWGTNPEDVVPITSIVPDPAQASDPDKRKRMEQALQYMGLVPGMRVNDITVDRVFIGTCTNGRIDDLRDAAWILRGRKAVVSGWVSPGSTAVKRLAEAEGLDQVFRDAGLEWRASACSGCAAINGDAIEAGLRCASTSNRNFEGRQGKGARTHIMSPAMAAASALTGRLTDPRLFAR